MITVHCNSKQILTKNCYSEGRVSLLIGIPLVWSHSASGILNLALHPVAVILLTVMYLIICTK